MEQLKLELKLDDGEFPFYIFYRIIQLTTDK